LHRRFPYKQKHNCRVGAADCSKLKLHWRDALTRLCLIKQTMQCVQYIGHSLQVGRYGVNSTWRSLYTVDNIFQPSRTVQSEARYANNACDHRQRIRHPLVTVCGFLMPLEWLMVNNASQRGSNKFVQALELSSRALSFLLPRKPRPSRQCYI